MTLALTVIIPTLNEEKNIGDLCRSILALHQEIDILVVDDGSTDKTQEIVKEFSQRVKLLDRTDESMHGLSISVFDGIKLSTNEYFMVIDGDFQHPPESLLDALKCTKNSPDLIIGYRIKVEHWPISRKMMSKVATLLAKFSLLIRRKPIPRDVMSGFFGGKREFILQYLSADALKPKGYKILFDLLKLIPKQSIICEFPYTFKNREFGVSKIGKTHIIEFFKSLF
ncbi:MAG: glycosyltransferase [Candidatus Heimdallarchaeota archaeon]|nr:glycosyltransferase [Candidatus Heimdallarchaeota archaeon]